MNCLLLLFPQEKINILGLNTRSNRESSIRGYNYNYVKCKCSERIEKSICKDLQTERVGARTVTVG